MPLTKQDLPDRVIYHREDPFIEVVIHKDAENMNMEYRAPYPDHLPSWEAYMQMIDDREGL